MKQLEEPIKDLTSNLLHIMNKKIIIMKMKFYSSSCPIIQVSTLILKKCPILRTIVWKICCCWWENNHFPGEWKNSTIILIHKIGNTDDPPNFRSNTVEPILPKVMTSHIWDRIFTFVVEYNYVETNIHKRFWSNISGAIERTELQTNISKHTRNKQRQLVVTLFNRRMLLERFTITK